jgi:hypothetical protein
MMKKITCERRQFQMNTLVNQMLERLSPGGGKVPKDVAKMSKPVDYHHFYPSIRAEEMIKQAGGRVNVEVELDENKRPLAYHITPSPNGDYELTRPRQGRPYFAFRVRRYGLSAESVPAKRVEETVTEDKIVVKVPSALCPTE